MNYQLFRFTSLLVDHTTIPVSTSQETSTVVIESTSIIYTASPTPDDLQSESSLKIETLQLALVIVVAGLLILAIVLTVTLITLLLTRFGRKSKRSSGEQ